jgi:hypothetical protein
MSTPNKTAQVVKAANTRRFGDRLNEHVRVTDTQLESVMVIAKSLGLARATVWNLALALFAAQYAPLLAQHGLNLDRIEADLKLTLEEARRAVEIVNKHRAKLSKP